MPVELDIAGNFAKGAKAMSDRRRDRQFERARDYDLAAQDDTFQARRSDMGYAGWDPNSLSELQTNDDPWLMKVGQWWKQRRANRVMPSNMMPEQRQTATDEAAVMGRAIPSPDMSPAQTYPVDDQQPDIDAEPFRNGGRVRRAIPQYADGGDVASEDEMIRRRAAASRARGAGAISSTEKAVGDTARRAIPGMMDSLSPSVGSRIAGGARALAGGAARLGVRALGPVGTAIGASMPTETGDDERHMGDRAQLAPGASWGPGGDPYNPEREPPSNGTAIPKTPDEAVAQEAIRDGTKMAEQAKEQSKPPGAIDFSMVDAEPSDIPNMPVKDWVAYRQQALKSLTARGVSLDKAMEESQQSVTKLQQQGFVDYAQQALMHLQGGNAKAAALAMRAAYQYFPNGSDVRLGVQQGKDGNPALVGMGVDEETGKPKGQPMIITPERLSVMIENFSKPDAFRTWTKDWRDDSLKQRKYEEVEKPQAESEMTYRERAGKAALMTGQANLAYRTGAGTAGGGGRRTQTQLDHANDAFTKAVEMLGYNDQPEADKLMSIMSQIYAQSPWQYPQVIEFVRKAKEAGRLDEVAQSLGLGE